MAGPAPRPRPWHAAVAGALGAPLVAVAAPVPGYLPFLAYAVGGGLLALALAAVPAWRRAGAWVAAALCGALAACVVLLAAAPGALGIDAADPQDRALWPLLAAYLGWPVAVAWLASAGRPAVGWAGSGFAVAAVVAAYTYGRTVDRSGDNGILAGVAFLVLLLHALALATAWWAQRRRDPPPAQARATP